MWISVICFTRIVAAFLLLYFLYYFCCLNIWKNKHVFYSVLCLLLNPCEDKYFVSKESFWLHCGHWRQNDCSNDKHLQPWRWFVSIKVWCTTYILVHAGNFGQNYGFLFFGGVGKYCFEWLQLISVYFFLYRFPIVKADFITK